MGYVLGISAHYHDAAAAIVADGVVVAAAQEERFSRQKHDPRFPVQAVNYCLGEAFIEPDELDCVVYYDRPAETLDRVLKNAATVAPAGRERFVDGVRAMLGAKARLLDDLEACLGMVPRVMTTQHHAAHAASSFFPSPFADAAVLTIDGVGEWATCSIGVGRDRQLELINEIHYPHSLGMLYSAFTSFCGFAVNDGEYKLMGLAPYGEPRFAQDILDELIDLRPDGSFRLQTDAFAFLAEPKMCGPTFDALFGGPPRIAEQRITPREMDLAASVQAVIEEAVLRLARTAMQTAGSRNLAMAGGVALNCVANGRLWRECDLDGLWVQPAAGDAGGALGAALLASHHTFGAPRTVAPGQDGQQGSLLGPSYSPAEVHAFLDRHALPHDHLPDAEERAAAVADCLDDGAVVAHFSGRMEYGPRALGSRSILGDPRRPDLQRRMNLAVKNRESFRPFAPAVLEEHATDHFELAEPSPYMLLVSHVAEGHRLSADVDEDADMLAVIAQTRSHLPAITHVDYSARLQTVGSNANPDFRKILEAFHRRTGCPVVVNTSFNVRDEPIVCTPQDAYRCFVTTDIDVLVLGEYVLYRDAQPSGSAVALERTTAEAALTTEGELLSESKALGLFDSVLVPLAHDRAWFPLGPDRTAASYFEPVPDPSVALPRDVHGVPGRGAHLIIDEVCDLWRSSGDMDLAALDRGLREVADAMDHELFEQGIDVDIHCYTLF